MQWVVHKCLTGFVNLKRVEPPLKATPAQDNHQHQETRKWLLKLEQSFAITGDSHLVQQFLAKHGTTQLQQPPYSPDLAPSDFFLFPRLKKVLKGHRFEAMEDIKWNSTKSLLDIPKEEFTKCFQQWQKRWAKCVAVEGNYVEDN